MSVDVHYFIALRIHNSCYIFICCHLLITSMEVLHMYL